jgi:hypothetical protein
LATMYIITCSLIGKWHTWARAEISTICSIIIAGWHLITNGFRVCWTWVILTSCCSRIPLTFNSEGTILFHPFGTWTFFWCTNSPI